MDRGSPPRARAGGSTRRAKGLSGVFALATAHESRGATFSWTPTRRQETHTAPPPPPVRVARGVFPLAWVSPPWLPLRGATLLGPQTRTED